MAELIQSDDVEEKKPMSMQPAKKTGTGFTNIGRIVQANQGNRLGKTIGTGIQNVAQQTKQNIGQAQQQFQQQAQANRLDSAQNQQRVASVLNDPSKASEADIQAFGQYRSGQYGGPTGLQNAQQLASQAAQAESLGQAATSAGGRQALLQRFAGTPQYSAGQQRLDSLLLGQTGANDIRQARRATVGLGQNLMQSNEAAAAQAGELANRAKAFGEDVNTQLQNQINPLSSDLDARVKAAQDAELARQTQLNETRAGFSGIGGNYVGDQAEVEADQKALDTAFQQGLIPQEQYNQLTNANKASMALDLTNVFNNPNAGQGTRWSLIGGGNYQSMRDLLNQNLKDVGPTGDATRAGFASNDELARLNALQRLSGQQAEFDPARQAYTAGNTSLNLTPLLERLGIKAPSVKGSADYTVGNPANTGIGF